MMLDGRDPAIIPWMLILADANQLAHPLALAKSAECEAILGAWLDVPAFMRNDADGLALTAEMHGVLRHWRWLVGVLVERPAVVWPIEVSSAGLLHLIVGEG
jgi:hypothetical protein